MEMKFLTFDDVCTALGITAPTLHSLLQRKEIDGYKVGRQWRFTEQHVQEYLERNRNIQETDSEDK